MTTIRSEIVTLNRARLQVTTRQVLVLVLATAVGFAICPEGQVALGLLTPFALVLRRVAPEPAIATGIFLLIVAAFFELFLKFPVHASLYAPIALLLVPPWLWLPTPDPRASRLGMSWPGTGRFLRLLAVYVLIGTLYFFPWSTRKRFLRDLDAIRPGMTVAETRRRMAGYREGTGWENPSTGQELRLRDAIVFRHSDDPQFNADWGIVTIKDGRVVDVAFHPD